MTNYIGSEWRDRDTRHTYKVMDQTGLSGGVPIGAGDDILVLKLYGRRSVFSNPQRVVTVTSRFLHVQYEQYSGPRIAAPSVGPLSGRLEGQ